MFQPISGEVIRGLYQMFQPIPGEVLSEKQKVYAT